MKKIIGLFIIMILFSCKNENKDAKLCLSQVKYNENKDELLPPVLKIEFIDEDSYIEKKSKDFLIKDVIFLSIDKKDRVPSYLKLGYYEKNDNKTSLYVSNSFLISTKKDVSKIEDSILRYGIGLVVNKDTIQINSCN